ncbi:hypothetical protein [Enhygromyxa salina]|uniref:Uncharacterized protein n=1 Tax=Enhygromyxa salina TaxID=215803 RepID=A0A2S9XC21_9BACT|nr:hypothetical protein [Enhygromyxa salina]PRP90405.1 hypothetical protein ENSA7_82900 [Enhygromyxa salina]
MSPNFGTVSDLRAGDPAATAIAVFKQGCTNQSEATAQAVVAASVYRGLARIERTARSLQAVGTMQTSFNESSERPKLITMQIMTDERRPAVLARRVVPTLLLSARSREMSTP